MRLKRILIGLACAAFLGAAASEEFWHTGVTDAGAPFAISYDEDGRTPMLRFECTPDALIATVYGARELTDPESGRTVGDGPRDEMLGSAAQLALITDSVDAHWAWAEAEHNPGGGWNLTGKLPLDHPGLLAFPQAKMIAIATAGGGATAAGVEPGDRARLAEFVRQCRKGSG